MRTYPHKGKFEGEPIVAPALYEWAQSYADEECGDIQEFGFYAWLFEGHLDFMRAADLAAHGISVDDFEEMIDHAGAILTEDSNGFVRVQLVKKVEHLRAAWNVIEAMCAPVEPQED